MYETEIKIELPRTTAQIQAHITDLQRQAESLDVEIGNINARGRQCELLRTTHMSQDDLEVRAVLQTQLESLTRRSRDKEETVMGEIEYWEDKLKFARMMEDAPSLEELEAEAERLENLLN